MSDTQDKKQDSGRWVLFSLIVFFVMFATVDAFFVYKAVTTNVGVVTDHSYKKGLAYDDFLSQAAQQSHDGTIGEAVYNDADGTLALTLTDADGAPISGGIVVAHLVRPVHKGYDFEAVMHYKGEGRYSIRPDFPLIGQWVAYIEAKWTTADQQHKRYVTKKVLIAE